MKISSTSICCTLLFFAPGLALPTLAQPDATIPKLIGIARITDYSCVVLEIPSVRPAGSGTAMTMILREGERE